MDAAYQALLDAIGPRYDIENIGLQMTISRRRSIVRGMWGTDKKIIRLYKQKRLMETDPIVGTIIELNRIDRRSAFHSDGYARAKLWPKIGDKTHLLGLDTAGQGHQETVWNGHGGVGASFHIPDPHGATARNIVAHVSFKKHISYEDGQTILGRYMHDIFDYVSVFIYAMMPYEAFYQNMTTYTDDIKTTAIDICGKMYRLAMDLPIIKFEGQNRSSITTHYVRRPDEITTQPQASPDHHGPDVAPPSPDAAGSLEEAHELRTLTRAELDLLAGLPGTHPLVRHIRAALHEHFADTLTSVDTHEPLRLPDTAEARADVNFEYNATDEQHVNHMDYASYENMEAIGIKSIDAMKVMRYMCALSNGEFTEINQSVIAKNVGLHRQNVARAIKYLEERGFILKSQSRGRALSYKLIRTARK